MKDGRGGGRKEEREGGREGGRDDTYVHVATTCISHSPTKYVHAYMYV